MSRIVVVGGKRIINFYQQMGTNKVLKTAEVINDCGKSYFVRCDGKPIYVNKQECVLRS